ncbi:MAG: aminotransferase class I/II-fold pyridoxal phosphate-dependent enzyme [Acidimicrobiales bacterium]|jgi:cystathionine beta-lyase|nr:aminotransferase class I/II-fold pyridoxal phosphate-dependent enzyme [Acidimicrobiales bacterium]MDP6910580.1 aminotransferase class I/II-fold pyridoxal phosphate-dependent enzyme [Acidimicrobiales bacterium]
MPESEPPAADTPPFNDSLLSDHVDIARKVASGGYKWTHRAPEWIPAFVAEHDLGPFPAMRNRLREVVDLGGFGYHATIDHMIEAFCGWSTRRYGWTPDPALTVPNTSVIQGVWSCVEAFTEPTGAVILTPPIYFPFNTISESTGRRTVDWRLIKDDNGWHYDLDGLAHLLADDPGIQMLLLCHPHNPTGRVLTTDQLTRIVELASEHDVVIVSDEIHADFTYPGATHVPLAAVPGAASCTVTVTSGIKTFAMGGLRASVASFADEDMLVRYRRIPEHLLGSPNRLGCEAAIVGWEEGDTWVDQLVALFDHHRHHLASRLADELPDVRMHVPQSTFLAWLDLSALGPGDRPGRWLRDRTGVDCKDGPLFGPGGEGHARLTFGTSTALLDEIIDRLVSGIGTSPASSLETDIGNSAFH